VKGLNRAHTMQPPRSLPLEIAGESDDETDDVSASRPVQDSEDTGTPATTKPTQRIVQR
jgi:hypothetical protein